MRKILLMILVGFLSLAISAFAAEEAKKEADKGGMFIKYKPPQLGKPDRRVGGGTRGAGKEEVVFSALAPDHASFTSSSQPALCWFVSRPQDMRIELAINDESSLESVLEKRLPMQDKPGEHCVKLTDLNVKLQEGKEYQWLVALILDQKQRSKDIISGGSIILKKPSPDMERRLASAKGIDRVSILAEEGYWYDAYAVLSTEIMSHPGNSEYRLLRLQFLNQSGLKDIADALDKK